MTMSREPVHARCPCGERTTVPDSLRGGVINCPRCGKLVEVPAKSEWFYWSLIGMAGVAGAAFTAAAWRAGGATAGLAVALLCALIVTAIVKLS